MKFVPDSIRPLLNIQQDIKIDLHDITTWPVLLQQNLSILNHDEKNVVKELLSLGQQHLFATWDPIGTNDDLKHSLFAQIKELNKSYNGGLSAYVKNARKLLASAKKGENPFEGWRPEVPHGVKLEPVTEEYVRYEQAGIPQLGFCGFVLVAGGLGERLGYSGVKVALPSQTVTNATYLELYCTQILHIQNRYATMQLPLAIMVSDDTIAQTVDLLESNNYFGLQKEQVTILKQGKVPALLSNSAHIALASSYQLDAKPHGHGDVHTLMHSTGTARKWKNAGVRNIVFFQDTNGLGFYTLPALLGVSEILNLDVNSLAVDRFAKQSVGALTRLVHTDGRQMTINVEYNQLDPLLRATINPQGDVNDPATGLSPFPGNINHLLFRIDPYVKVLNKTEGHMPEFVNPKYTDATRNLFKKPTRLECMMQDFPRLLPAESKVGFTALPAWVCYSPMKNNATDAAIAVASGVPSASPFTAECDQYYVFAELLRRMGANIATEPPLTILGITASPAPRIVFHPSFGIFAHEIAAKFPRPDRVRISATSTLVLEGDVTVEHLQLNGSAKVVAAPGSAIIVRASDDFGGEAVVNSGHVLKVLRAEDTNGGRVKVVDEEVEVQEADRIRGYVLECVDMCFAATGAESNSKFAGAVPMQLTRVGTAATPNCSEVYVFNGQKLVESQDAVPVYEEEGEEVYYDDEDDCCNITACLVPELGRSGSRVQKPVVEEEEIYYEECTLVGWLVPELNRN